MSGLQNQGFDVFRKKLILSPTWFKFGPKRPKAFKRGAHVLGYEFGCQKGHAESCERIESRPGRPLREDLPASLGDILKTLREDMLASLRQGHLHYKHSTGAQGHGPSVVDRQLPIQNPGGQLLAACRSSSTFAKLTARSKDSEKGCGITPTTST